MRIRCLLGRIPALMLLSTAPAWTARAEAVKLELFEDLPEKSSWSAPAHEPATLWAIPALGITRLPAKYSERGIEIDRSNPCAIRGSAMLRVPAGSNRLILRSRNAAQLLIDDRVLAETPPTRPNGAGHEDVPEAAREEDPRWLPPAPGVEERVVEWTSDGKEHQLVLWAKVGGKGLRAEPGAISVSIVVGNGLPQLVGSEPAVYLTEESWSSFVESERLRLDAADTAARRRAAGSDNAYWQARHALARRELGLPAPGHSHAVQPTQEESVIDRRVSRRLHDAGIDLPAVVNDAGFLRRLTLDTVGVVPTPPELEAFLSDRRADKRNRAINSYLADSRWADGWMGYWQDVLAENPGILKPTLNNTGPFRRYLHNAFTDNVPFDRFVTELVRMEGSALGGGPAGFALATQNDAPMAAKAHVLAKAFLAVELKCARCHDAPFHPYAQSDLFAMAGLLAGKSQRIPPTSTVKRQPGGRAPKVTVSLEAGDTVEPSWDLSDIAPSELPEGLLPPGAGDRERLAALITSPRSSRFARVIVNRMWKRYMGTGLVEPVDDWDGETRELAPDLLTDLANELIAHDYDLKHVARLILCSRAYQSQVREHAPTGTRNQTDAIALAAPVRRRLSAEQLLDSLLAVAGKRMNAEELNLDPDGRRPQTEFLNLGVPRRAWELTSTSNERDRPALSLPVTQSLVDVLQTFGWRASRPDPISVREESVTPLQPALLANGLVAARVARLSDDSAFTALCLEDQPPEALVRAIYSRILSRPPSDLESSRIVEYLGATYPERVVPGAKALPLESRQASRRVSWSNHLSPEATRIQLEREQAVRAGDPPTPRLTTVFRERMEDVVWALVNSPEFVYVP